jgi:hypothetical protein
MTAFYDDMAKVALDLLTEFGQTVTLRQVATGGGDYNPLTGQTTGVGLDGAFDSYRKGLPTDPPGNRIGSQYGQTLEKGNLIQDNDKWVYIDANGPAPRLQDHVIVQGIEYVTIDVQMVSPGGTPIIYLVVLRA